MRALARRQALVALMGGSAGLLFGDRCAATEPKTRRLGISIYALGIHQRNHWDGRHTGLTVPVAFLEECRRLGAGGIQCPFPLDDPASASEVRRRAEQYGLHVEGIIEPPASDAETQRRAHVCSCSDYPHFLRALRAVVLPDLILSCAPRVPLNHERQLAAPGAGPSSPEARGCIP